MKRLIPLLAIFLVACNKTGAPADPLDATAMRTCKDTIESRATNKNSVNYLDDDMPVTKAQNGQRNVQIKFSAKDEIGRASTMLAACSVSADGKSLLNIVVKDAR